RGAPLMDEEIPELERAFPAIAHYLPVRHLEAIQTSGMYEGEPGSWATTCIDNKACVFVYYEGDIAKCSLEKGYLNGETTWRKPISCHLFPIRVTSQPRTMLRYETIEECDAAVERGEQEHITLPDFLKEPLIRRFGEEWYNEFIEVCNEHKRIS
ncbi:MAG: DUF3109 family protein, partial [Bacteroidetes bacterium]